MATSTNPLLEPIFKKLQEAFVRRGSSTLVGLGRFFRICDRDKSGTLSRHAIPGPCPLLRRNRNERPSAGALWQREEFALALRKYQLVLQERELALLFDEFDRNKDGSITYTEFLRSMRGTLNDARKAVVKKAFDKLDRDGSGVITVDDVRGVYSVKTNPEVVSGKKSADEVLQEFLGSFDGPDRDGKITLEEFEEYYASVSSCVDDDRHFNLIVFQAWKL
eukprot:m51a1_g7746 putative calcyphosin-like protein (221) ;mRNA; r:23716-24603